MSERVGIVPEVGRHERFHGGTDAINDGPEAFGMPIGGLSEIVDRREHGATTGVAQHDHQAGAEALGRELHAADL